MIAALAFLYGYISALFVFPLYEQLHDDASTPRWFDMTLALIFGVFMPVLCLLLAAFALVVYAIALPLRGIRWLVGRKS